MFGLFLPSAISCSKASDLPRPMHAGVLTVTLALSGVLVALFGNVQIHPEHLVVFLKYFLPTMAVVSIMLNRTAILNLVLSAVDSLARHLPRASRLARLKVRRQLCELVQQEFVFFTKGDKSFSRQSRKAPTPCKSRGFPHY